jgi:hypothetical protein
MIAGVQNHMENETTKNRPLKTAFLLDPPSLKSLQTLLAEIHGPVEYRVKFSDGTTVKYDDVEEVIGQPNAGTKSIVSIMTSVEGEGRSAFLGMRGAPEPSVEYTLTGMQRDVIYFSEKLDVWIASCTQWYSTFYTSNLGLLLAVGVITLPVFFAGRVGKVFPPGKRDWHSYLAGMTLVGVAVAEYWTLKLFPRATFAVGYGAKRNQLFSVIRISVLLAVAVALVREWLMRHL